MEKEKLEQARAWVRQQLGECVDFWLEHGMDREHGGVYTCLDRKGEVYSTDKSVWMQGRCAWTFSYLCHVYGRHLEWMAAAKSCLDFLEEHCIDRAAQNRMYFTVTADGRPLRRRRYCFSEGFYAIANAEYYCFTERELPKIKAAGVPISFDFSDDSTDEYYERIAPLVDYAFMSCSDISREETLEKLKKVAALGPRFVCASRGEEGCIAYDGAEFYVQDIKPVENMVDTMAAGDSLLTAFLVNYLAREKEGRGGPEAIRESLDLAAGFAANTCGLAGSWGHGKVYE